MIKIPVLTQGWLKKCSTNEAEVLRALFHKIYGDAHTFVQTRLQNKMMLLEALYIRQCIDLLEGLDIGNTDPTSKYKILSSTVISDYVLMDTVRVFFINHTVLFCFCNFLISIYFFIE